MAEKLNILLDHGLGLVSSDCEQFLLHVAVLPDDYLTEAALMCGDSNALAQDRAHVAIVLHAFNLLVKLGITNVFSLSALSARLKLIPST
jgi:hypothetical protein